MDYRTTPFGNNYRDTFNIGDLVQWFQVNGKTKKGIITKISLKNVGGREGFFAELLISNNKNIDYVVLPIVVLDLISPAGTSTETI